MSIHEGYRPGCIGDIVALHARTYARIAGFGVFFEAKVAAELAEFVGRLPSDNKRMWLYLEDDRIKGSLVPRNAESSSPSPPTASHSRALRLRGLSADAV